MGPLSMPFKLDFEVKSKGGIMIALFGKNTNESIFVEISKYKSPQLIYIVIDPVSIYTYTVCDSTAVV